MFILKFKKSKFEGTIELQLNVVTTYLEMDFPSEWRSSLTRHWKASPNLFGCSTRTVFHVCKSLSSDIWGRPCTGNNRQTCPLPERICSCVSRERHLVPMWHIFRQANHCWRRMETTKFGKERTGLSVHETTPVSPADKTYLHQNSSEKSSWSTQFEQSVI